MSTPPKSVTVSEFLGLGQVPTLARTPCWWVAGITRCRVGAHSALRGLQAKFTALVDSIDGGANRGLGAGPPQS